MHAIVLHDDLAQDVEIPAWVIDLESFRRWARSEEFPRRGWFSHLAGKLWVDRTMEKFYSHNQVKGEFAVVLGALVRTLGNGRFVHDRMLFSNPDAKLSTEPDGAFVSYKGLRSGRVRMTEDPAGDGIELEGSPDMVLEVVSRGSVGKDTSILRELYHRAGVREYWIVDARREPFRFEILHAGADGYAAAPAEGGWLRSEVFGRWFSLARQADPLGKPLFVLSVRA